MFCILAFLAHYVAWRHFFTVLLGSPIRNERWKDNPETDMPCQIPASSGCLPCTLRQDGDYIKFGEPMLNFAVESDTSGNGSGGCP